MIAWDSSHLGGVSIERHKLDLIGLVACVDVDYCADIPGLQAGPVYGRCKHNPIVFAEPHRRSLSPGYAVISRGRPGVCASRSSSTIQTVTTTGVRPPGVDSLPTRVYRTP